MADSRPAPGAALAVTTALSILLAPLLVLGPFIAGFAGGRRAKESTAAFGAALIPALLWAAAWWWITEHNWRIGSQTINLAALGLRVLAPATALAIIGGALAGSNRRPGRAVGGMLVIFALGWVAVNMRDAYNVYRTVMPQGGDAAPVAENKTCPDHLKKLYDAVKIYAESYDDTLPPADRWMTALTDPTQQLAEEPWLHCPEVSQPGGSEYGYAMNAAVGGKRLSEIQDQDKTPLFYDSSKREKDAHDNLESLPQPGRHGGRNNVVMVNGTARQE
jgi:hypothetical protein